MSVPVKITAGVVALRAQIKAAGKLTVAPYRRSRRSI